MPRKRFSAGVGRVCITPPLTALHAAWGAQVHTLPDWVESDLWATVLVVTDGTQMAAFVDLDLVIISRDESDAIRGLVASHLEISPSNVRVSVTHNHAGPPPSTWDWTKDGGAELRRYYDSLPDQIGGAARLALDDLRQARMAVGTGTSNVAVNRRETAPDGRPATGVNLNGAIDPQVLVVRIDDADQRPLASIVGYTMHPTTLGPTNRVISPDWPGHMKRTVEAITGSTCLFVQGATGDIGPGPEGFTDDLRVVRKIGAQVGCEAARVYLGLDVPDVTHRHERIWESGASLGKWTAVENSNAEPAVRTSTRSIHLPVRPQPTVDEALSTVEAAELKLETLRSATAAPAKIETAMFAAKRANMALARARTYGGHGTYPVDLHLLQIGQMVLAGMEGEPFSEIGISIKENSPFPFTWFGGYTGGWAGYIPTAEEFPRAGYEVDTSPFTEEAASCVITETLSALKDLEP